MKKFALILIAVFCYTCAFAQPKNPRAFVKAALPGLSVGSQGLKITNNWDLGCGYHLTKHFSVCLDAGWGSTSFEGNNGLFKKQEKMVIPSVRLYLDQKKVFFVSLGSSFTLGHAEDSYDENLADFTRKQDFWRHTMKSSFGIDLYFRPKEKPFNFGIELEAGKSFLIWGNFDAWTYALDARAGIFSASLFVSF